MIEEVWYNPEYDLIGIVYPRFNIYYMTLGFMYAVSEQELYPIAIERFHFEILSKAGWYCVGDL